MKIALYFIAVIYSAVALPAEIPLDTPDELIPNDPNNPSKTADLPGSRVIGGTELAPHSVPYQAALLVNGNSMCGGSLISTTRILTVASYTHSASYVDVRLGAHYFDEEEESQVRLTSTSILIHEDYDVGGGRSNDIAIVFLPSEAPLNNNIAVVALAPADADTYEESWGLFAGWGISTEQSKDQTVAALRGVNLNVISNEACRNIYGGAVVTDTKLCTSGYGIVGGCDRDSGGALVVKGVQIGIATFYGERCDGSLPTGFTRVSSFRPWLDQHTDE